MYATTPLVPFSRASRWLDQRNQSRIAQFEANRAALLASATSTVSPSSPSASAAAAAAEEEGAGEEEKEVDPKSKTFGTTAEFAGLAARLLHVGIGQVCVSFCVLVYVFWFVDVDHVMRFYFCFFSCTGSLVPFATFFVVADHD